MKKHEVGFRPRAEADLFGLYRYIAEDSGRAVAGMARHSRLVIMPWSVEPLNEAVEAELLALPRHRDGVEAGQGHQGMSARYERLKKKMLANPDVRQAYEAMRPEFELAHELIAARGRAGLSQAALAKRMKTTQSAIARIESGKHWPSRKTLERYAKATGTRAVIKLVAAQ